MAWIIINQGPLGMNATLSGPADVALAFSSYPLPLACLELYFWAQSSASARIKYLAGDNSAYDAADGGGNSRYGFNALVAVYLALIGLLIRVQYQRCGAEEDKYGL